jgi:hypothetical protein
MNDDVSLRRLAEVLNGASPDAVHSAVIDHLEATLVGSVVDILLVDYPQRSLHSVSWPNVVEINGTPAGRAYLENSLVVLENQTWVPLDAHGACLGVLSVVGPELDTEATQHLIDCATIIVRAMITAERVTDTYRRARRKDRMTLAAELQWTLLPGRGLASPAFALAGQLEPAMSIRGDTYDWSVDDGNLTVLACNGMGEGTNASLLSSLCVAALRNARRSGLAFEEQLGLANDSVWAQYGGKLYSEAMVLSINSRTGAAQVIDAGSPRLYRLRDGKCRRVELESQLPLGMFEGTRYGPQLLNLRSGDRLVLVSDGALATPQQPDKLNDTALTATIVRTAGLTPTATVRALIEDVWTAAGEDDLTDDAVAVCLDWHQ